MLWGRVNKNTWYHLIPLCMKHPCPEHVAQCRKILCIYNMQLAIWFIILKSVFKLSNHSMSKFLWSKKSPEVFFQNINSQFFFRRNIVSRSGIQPRNLYSKNAPAHPYDQANVGNRTFTWFNQMLSLLLLYLRSLKVKMSSQNRFFFLRLSFQQKENSNKMLFLLDPLFSLQNKNKYGNIISKLSLKLQSPLILKLQD